MGSEGTAGRVPLAAGWPLGDCRCRCRDPPALTGGCLPQGPRRRRPVPRAPLRPPEAAGHGGGGCQGDGEAERDRAEVRAGARPRREGAAICRLLRGFIAFGGFSAGEREGAA